MNDIFSNTIDHIVIMENKDIVQIEKVSDDTFALWNYPGFRDNAMWA